MSHIYVATRSANPNGLAQGLSGIQGMVQGVDNVDEIEGTVRIGEILHVLMLGGNKKPDFHIIEDLLVVGLENIRWSNVDLAMVPEIA